MKKLLLILAACAVGHAPCLTASDDHGFVIDEAEVPRRPDALREREEREVAEREESAPALAEDLDAPGIGTIEDLAAFLGIRPARKASLPARTASRIARAMRTGSRAPAMPVFIRTPAAPSSPSRRRPTRWPASGSPSRPDT